VERCWSTRALLRKDPKHVQALCDRYHRAVAKPSKSLAKSESTLKRTVRAVPWAVLLQGTVIVGKRWAALSAKERARFTELVRKSRGRIGNLSVRERLELRKLGHKLDVKGMSRDLMLLSRRGKRRRKRR
jgi:hypothetical protein